MRDSDVQITITTCTATTSTKTEAIFVKFAANIKIVSDFTFWTELTVSLWMKVLFMQI